MLKKLINQESEYKREKFEKNFQETRRYKNNICHYPSINFYKTKVSLSSPLVQSYDFNQKNYKVFKTEGKLPKLKDEKNRTNFMSLQTKYAMKTNELDPRYFKEARKTNRINNFNKSNINKNKKDMSSVSEDENDNSSSNKKSDEDEESNDDKNSESNGSGSDNEDEKNSGIGSGSGSGSGSGD